MFWKTLSLVILFLFFVDWRIALFLLFVAYITNRMGACLPLALNRAQNYLYTRLQKQASTLRNEKQENASIQTGASLTTLSTESVGIVYLIKSGELYKIGMTTGTIENRVKSLQTGSPHRLEIIHTIKTNDPHNLETYLHDLFKNKRVNGEWFNLDKRDIALIRGLDADTEYLGPSRPSTIVKTVGLPDNGHIENSIVMTITCPQCQKSQVRLLNENQSKYIFFCSRCLQCFTSIVGTVRKKRSRKEAGTNQRHFSIRLIGLDEIEHHIEFTNSSNKDFELTARDSIVISYIGNKVRLVENDTINTIWQVSESRCYIATYLYGPTSPEVQLLRDFRDNVLLQSQGSASLVQAYYRISPVLIDKFGHGRLFRLCSLMLTRSVLWFIRQWPDRKHWVDRSAHRKAPR